MWHFLKDGKSLEHRELSGNKESWRQYSLPIFTRICPIGGILSDNPPIGGWSLLEVHHHQTRDMKQKWGLNQMSTEICLAATILLVIFWIGDVALTCSARCYVSSAMLVRTSAFIPWTSTGVGPITLPNGSRRTCLGEQVECYSSKHRRPFRFWSFISFIWNDGPQSHWIPTEIQMHIRYHMSSQRTQGLPCSKGWYRGQCQKQCPKKTSGRSFSAFAFPLCLFFPYRLAVDQTPRRDLRLYGLHHRHQQRTEMRHSVSAAKASATSGVAVELSEL